MSLEGRGAVVTGGGRGIGAATASALAEAGCAVVLAARTEGEIRGLAASLRARGLAAAGVRCDVSDPESVTGLARSALREVGEVDILVNNAGFASSNPLHRVSLEEWERTFAVNATGTFLCTRAFLPAMVERGWGRVVNVASVAGLTGAAYLSAYAASKHAVVGFTRAVAAEVEAAGVTVNAVCPGYADTPMTEATIRRIVEKTGMKAEEALERLVAGTPQRRLVAPEEVAHSVLSLCAEAAGGATGQAVVVDGGGALGQ